MVFFGIFLACFGSYIIYKLAKPKENKNIKNNKINSTKKITVLREKYFNENLVDLSYFIENNDLIKDLKGLGAKLLFFKDSRQLQII